MRVTTLFVCAVMAAIGGCGGGDSTGPSNTQTLGAITTTPSSIGTLQAGSTTSIVVHGTDTDGNPIANLTGVSFLSQNENVAVLLAGGTVIGLSSGTTQVTVTVSFHGVTKVANVPVTVVGTLPTTNEITGSTSSFTWNPAIVAVARTGTVSFTFGSLNHSVLFATVTGAPANVPTTTNATVPRTFNTAGNFSFECGVHPGMTGTVIVR